MRVIIFLQLIIWGFSSAFCQLDSIAAKDSLIIVNQYIYDLDFGISMFHRDCPNQKTYNKNGLLLREIDYGKAENSKYKMNHIIYYYYDDNQRLISKEYYSNNADLLFLYIYSYHKTTGDTLNIKKGTISNNKFNHTEERKFKYKKGVLNAITEFNEYKKAVSITNITQKKKQQIKQKTYTKHSALSDSINSTFSYLTYENNQLSTQTIIQLYANSLSDTAKYTNEYNDKGFLIKQTYKKSNTTIYTKEFSYYPEGELKSVTQINSNNKKEAFVAYELTKLIRLFGGIESSYLKLSKQ